METARQHSEESAAKATASAQAESASHAPARQGLPSALHRLHRSHGNLFVQRMVRAGVVQAKLKISEPGDQYEQEADRVAERVMRMPARELPEEDETHEHAQQGQVQRMCTSCEDEEKVQRFAAVPGLLQRQAAEDEESLRQLSVPLGRTVQRKSGGAEQASQTSRSDSLDEGALQSGGQPLPTPVLSFYEERFGRDFGEVRVHTGAESSRANDDVSAYAFTYGNHVWLGRDQRVEPTHLLAHELAHVVQQKQPPLMRSARAKDSGRDRGDEGPRQSEAAGGELRIQRFVPYWEPYDMDGTDTHKLLLPEVGKQNSIFTEAPVPNAGKGSSGFDLKGCADLYGASTTVGVFFVGDQRPAALTTRTCPRLLKDGAKFSHITNAAPTVNVSGEVTRVDAAPKEIRLGDLKPTHLTIEALLGKDQLTNYKQGFYKAQAEVDEMRSVKPAGAKWGPIDVRNFGSAEIVVPPAYVYPGSTQKSRDVILKENSKPVDVRQRRRPAKLFMVADSRAGIWNYFWYPDTPVTVADLPPKVRNLGPEIESRIINPLINSPIQRARKAKPGTVPYAQQQKHAPAAPTVARLVVTHAPAPVLRRKATAPTKDTFDFGDWKKAHDDITKGFGAESKTSEFKEAEFSLKAARAQENEREKTKIPLPDISSAARQESKTLGKIEFWTGASSLPFGYLRRIFGTAFVKVAQFYIKVRDKFRDLLKSKGRAGGKSGLMGAALKAAFSVIKLAGSYVIQKTVDRLMESLETGLTEKAKALFNFDGVTAVEEKLAEIKKLQDDLEKKAVETVEGLLGKTVGPYLEKLKEIEEVQRVVSDILQIVNLVRWGARVIACLSPPGWGCLWILAESVIEGLAARVVETCWFKRKITPLINTVKFVADLPKDLADLIIGKLREFLPGPLHDVFATLDRSSVSVNADDIECEEAESGDALTPERQELLNMQEKLGEEKFQAFAELTQKSGVPKDKPLTVAEIKNLADKIQSSGVSAEQLKEYAANYQPATGGTPIDIDVFLENVKKGAPSTAGGAPGTPPETTPPETTPPTTTSGGGQSADEKDSDPSSSGSGDIVVANAKDRVLKGTTEGDLADSRVSVVNQSWSHTVGTTPELDMMGFYKGKAMVFIKYIKTKVISRIAVQKGSDAPDLIVKYQLQQGVDFRPIPGALDKGATVRALLEHKKG